jgi:hypothetical protein
MVGWELDPSIVHLAREHFGMKELELSGRLLVGRLCSTRMLVLGFIRV